jgi:hypothetical protein
MWLLSAAGRSVAAGDSLGVRYLATLVSNPRAEISVLDLVQQQSPDRTAADPAGQELLDADAKRAYRQRITELHQQIDDAESGSDPIRAEAARSELDWLLTELGHATGLAGRSRAFPAPEHWGARDGRAGAGGTSGESRALDRATLNPRRRGDTGGPPVAPTRVHLAQRYGGR